MLSYSICRWRTGWRPRRWRRPMPGSPSTVTRSAAFGPPTTIWRSPRSRHSAPTVAPARCRSPGSTESNWPSKRSSLARWRAPSLGIRSGRAAWACRSAIMPRQAPWATRRRSPQGSPGVLRHRGSGHHRECAGLLRREHQEGTAARLERHLGPCQRADPVQLDTGKGRAVIRRAPARATPGERSGIGSKHDGRAFGRRQGCARTPLAAGGLGAAGGAVGALRHRRCDQPEFPLLRQCGPDQPGGDDPAGARDRRHLHHPHGLDRSLGRGR